ncbi:hypothetical protein ACEPAI_5689 [Sanghuangporus weigelae]
MTDFQPQGMRFCYESLKSFSYQPYERTFPDSSVIFMETLINFLRPAISLSTLHLDVSYIDAFDGFDSELQAELPTVQVFSISNWRRGLEREFTQPFEPDPMREDSLARIIKAMKMPNARDISVSMVFIQTEGTFVLSEWLSAAFPDSYGMPFVSNVTFKILDLPVTMLSERTVVQVNGLFEHFQALESFSLDTGNCNVMLGDSDALETGLENLRSLQIKFNGEHYASFLGCTSFHG